MDDIRRLAAIQVQESANQHNDKDPHAVKLRRERATALTQLSADVKAQINSLNHTLLMKLHELATETGQPLAAMKLVAGFYKFEEPESMRSKLMRVQCAFRIRHDWNQFYSENYRDVDLPENEEDIDVLDFVDQSQQADSDDADPVDDNETSNTPNIPPSNSDAPNTPPQTPSRREASKPLWTPLRLKCLALKAKFDSLTAEERASLKERTEEFNMHSRQRFENVDRLLDVSRYQKANMKRQSKTREAICKMYTSAMSGWCDVMERYGFEHLSMLGDARTGQSALIASAVAEHFHNTAMVPQVCGVNNFGNFSCSTDEWCQRDVFIGCVNLGLMPEIQQMVLSKMGKSDEDALNVYTKETRQKRMKKAADDFRRARLKEGGVLAVPNAMRIHEQNPDPIIGQRFLEDGEFDDNPFSTPAMSMNMFARLAKSLPVQLPRLDQTPKRKRTVDDEPSAPGRVKYPAEIEREREMNTVHEALQEIWLAKFPSTLTKSGKFPAKPNELLEKAGLKWQLPDTVPPESIYIKKKNASLTRLLYTAISSGKVSLVPR